MAKQEATYLCDLGGEPHASGSDVRGSLAIYTSRGSFLLPDVDDLCADQVIAVLREHFQKMTPLIHAHNPVPMAQRELSADPNGTTCHGTGTYDREIQQAGAITTETVSCDCVLQLS